MQKLGADANIEKMGMSEAMQFPIMAGVSLCGMYFAMNYFGKDIVNHFLLAYIAVGGTTGIKALLYTFVGNKFESYDENYIVDFSIKAIGLDV